MSEDIASKPTIEQAPRPAATGPAAAPSIDEIAQRFPQLDVLDVLGTGGMGVVYKARQRTLDRMVALKVLPERLSSRHESFAERFTREARALARLQHPNIVSVYDSGAIDGMYYFIMEYVDGSNLRQLLAADDRRFEPAHTFAILRPVCDALDYAHSEGIAHRDIKPENILVSRKGAVKIADFGIAKLLQRPGTDYTLTHTQQIIGTMHYMAPEQIERPSMVDHRADIYSLGVVLYEMMTGELPIGRFPLPSERGVSDVRLDHIVLRALEKQPDRRYQHASEIKTDLSSIDGTIGEGIPTADMTIAFNRPMSSPSGGEGSAWRSAPPNSATPSWQSAALAPFTPPQPGLRSEGIAYACWLACMFGAAGVHRMYAGKWISGVIWLLTFGVFFIGQLVDLALIPAMIKKANAHTIAETRAPHASERRS